MTAVAKSGILVLLLLVIPRVFLVRLGDSGVRLEDILLLCVLPSAVSLLLAPQLRMKRVLLVVIAYGAVVLFSAGISALEGRMSLPTTVAYGVRPFFSIAAFAIGYRLRIKDGPEGKGLITLVSYVLYAQIVYSVGYAVGILPNVSSFGSYGITGLTNGPYELSAIACLISVLAFHTNRRRLVALSIVTVFLTRARIAIAATIFHLLWATTHRRPALRWAAIAAILALAVTKGPELGGSQISDTISSIAEFRESFSLVAQSRDDYLSSVDSEEANDLIIRSASGDPSTLLRVARWSVVIATALDQPAYLIIGMGPGYYSVALDGNYFRLIGETGLLGLFTYITLFLAIILSFPRGRFRATAFSLVAQLAIIAAFIDIFTSTKTMSLFWISVGVLKCEQHEFERSGSATAPGA